MKNSQFKVKIKKLHPDAVIPTYAHPGDAGMDLRTIERLEIKSGQRIVTGVGLAFEIPQGYAGLIWDKTGVSHLKGIKILGGVYDAGYRGEMQIGLINLSDKIVIFEKGNKICQMVIQPIITPEIIEAEELSEHPRGAGMHGSTGI
jgi:dUTP pyrophosphatase